MSIPPNMRLRMLETELRHRQREASEPRPPRGSPELYAWDKRTHEAAFAMQFIERQIYDLTHPLKETES